MVDVGRRSSQVSGTAARRSDSFHFKFLVDQRAYKNFVVSIAKSWRRSERSGSRRDHPSPLHRTEARFQPAASADKPYGGSPNLPSPQKSTKTMVLPTHKQRAPGQITLGFHARNQITGRIASGHNVCCIVTFESKRKNNKANRHIG